MTSEEEKPRKDPEEGFEELEEKLRDVDEARDKARKRKRGPYRKSSVGGRVKLS